MTKFSLSGKLNNGKLVTITWEDGQLSGTDPVAVATVELIARQMEGMAVRKMPAAVTRHDHLSSPYSAYALIAMVFPNPRELKLRGKLPPVDTGLPKGAVM